MTWLPEIEELRHRQTLALNLGGADKVARHRANGKLTVRERLAGITDPGSFQEIGSISGFPEYGADGKLASFMPANVLCGQAKIDGRPVFITGDDFTVRGGANDGGLREKFAQGRDPGPTLAGAADPAGRRHRRRRLGQTSGDHRPHLSARRAGVHRSARRVVGDPGGRVGSGFGRRHGRRACLRQSITR